MKTGARNQFFGIATPGSVNAEAVIDLPGGAIITLDSLEHLGLQKNSRACALFKADSVILGVNA